MLESHEYAELFPMIGKQDLESLATDIKQNGLLEKITTLNGKILDGRNRQAACIRAGVELTQDHFIEFTGDDPLKFVISKNISRRHLDKASIAKLAIKIHEYKYAEGKSSRLEKLNQGVERGVGASLPPRERTAKIIAKEMTDMGMPISEGSIKAARKLQQQSPEIYESMGTRGLTISGAQKKLRDQTQGIRKTNGVKLYDKEMPLFGRLHGDIADARDSAWTDKATKKLSAWLGTPEIGYLINIEINPDDRKEVLWKLYKTKGGKKWMTHIDKQFYENGELIPEAIISEKIEGDYK